MGNTGCCVTTAKEETIQKKLSYNKQMSAPQQNPSKKTFSKRLPKDQIESRMQLDENTNTTNNMETEQNEEVKGRQTNIQKDETISIDQNFKVEEEKKQESYKESNNQSMEMSYNKKEKEDTSVLIKQNSEDMRKLYYLNNIIASYSNLLSKQSESNLLKFTDMASPQKNIGKSKFANQNNLEEDDEFFSQKENIQLIQEEFLKDNNQKEVIDQNLELFKDIEDIAELEDSDIDDDINDQTDDTKLYQLLIQKAYSIFNMRKINFLFKNERRGVFDKYIMNKENNVDIHDQYIFVCDKYINYIEQQYQQNLTFLLRKYNLNKQRFTNAQDQIDREQLMINAFSQKINVPQELKLDYQMAIQQKKKIKDRVMELWKFTQKSIQSQKDIMQNIDMDKLLQVLQCYAEDEIYNELNIEIEHIEHQISQEEKNMKKEEKEEYGYFQSKSIRKNLRMSIYTIDEDDDEDKNTLNEKTVLKLIKKYTLTKIQD